jgi:serine/threonine protein kinase
MIGRAHPGACVGRFRLERPAGQGRRPGVWRGRDTRSGQPVAIELLDDWPDGDPAACASFGERLAAVAQLRHASIPGVLAYGIEDDTAYVVSVWIGSTTLASLGRRQAPRPSHVRLTLGVVASALAAAHDAGVPHLDLQPGSVALDLQRRPQLTHFLPSGPPLHPEVARRIGAPPAYWSPELLSERTVDAPADAYGLGLLIYELALGAPVVAGDREDQARRRIEEDLPPLAEAAPNFAQTDMALCRLCDELMGRDPWARPTLAESAERLLAPLGPARVRHRALAVRAAEPAPHPVQLMPAEPLVSLLSATADDRERESSLRRGEAAQPRPGKRAPQVVAAQDRRRPATALGLLATGCLLTLLFARASRDSRRASAIGVKTTHP